MSFRTFTHFKTTSFLLLVTAFAVSWAPPAFAQSKPAKKEKTEKADKNISSLKDDLGPIKEVRVVGNKKIEKDAIIAKLKSKVGDNAKRSVIAQDIKASHALGYFNDISVDYDNGILLVTVIERPTIIKIDFDGNDQISSSDLKDVIKLKEYSILDVNKVKEDIQLIQKHYEDKGFYLARVTHEVKKTEKPDEIELVYRVSDYDKVRIKKITFINNKRLEDTRLKSVLRNTKEAKFFSSVTMVVSS